MDPASRLTRESWILSRFRPCRYTDVSAKKFNSARCGAVFSGGHSLSPQPHHVKAAELHGAAAESHRRAAELHGKNDHKAGLDHAKKAETQSAEAHKATTAHGASVAIPAKG
jgi:hypothetical protein